MRTAPIWTALAERASRPVASRSRTTPDSATSGVALFGADMGPRNSALPASLRPRAYHIASSAHGCQQIALRQRQRLCLYNWHRNNGTAFRTSPSCRRQDFDGDDMFQSFEAPTELESSMDRINRLR